MSDQKTETEAESKTETKTKTKEVPVDQVFACSDHRKVKDETDEKTGITTTTVEGCGFRGKASEITDNKCPRCGKTVKAE